MQNFLTLNYFIEPERQGLYLLLPFTMPANVEGLTLRYQYERHHESRLNDRFTARQEINIVDLGLIAPDGTQVGASGSDKSEITISEVTATPGYRPTALTAGEWNILVGAYKIAPEGVQVTYELTFTFKKRRLLRGDLHTHTLASDGVLAAEELAWLALRSGLNFLAISDHNQMVSREALPEVPGLSLIPGVEWTHYQGHANFLGIDHPYDGSFAANTAEEIHSRFHSARQREALIMINHPYDEVCGWQFDWMSLPFDCLEIWNGPMRPSNLKSVHHWQTLLASGKKVAACGGSDFHRSTPFIFLGGPTTCVYAQSAGISDILDALRNGHSYITYAPDGPWLELTAGDAIPGDTVKWNEISELQVQAGGLAAGDILRVITGSSNEILVQAPADGQGQAVYHMTTPGFARVEIWRSFLPGIPALPALISNPIYFDP